MRAYRQLYVDGKVGSKKEFCETIGVYPQYFTRLQKGDLSISFGSICSMVKAYNISLDWLFFGGDAPVTYNGNG